MNVLHVNSVDLQGRRFNGYDLLDGLRYRGIAAKQAVLTKQTTDSRVVELAATPEERALHARVATAEERHSMNNMLFPWGRKLEQMDEFLEADLVHYHLIHNQVVSLLDLPRLFSLKPSVWTLHDPWAVTGHCIHPLECTGWLKGCEPCPHLDRRFAMRADRAGAMWRIKQRVYAECDVDIVVASEFMRDIVSRSPLTAELPHLHVLPFGVDMTAFQSADRTLSRDLLGVPQNDFVLLFRAAPDEIKGMRHLERALQVRTPDRPITLLTVDKTGLLEDLRPAYNVIDLGWLEDQATYAHAFAASDVFVMPSQAESFGLMALEAMAACLPVISLEGTALPSLTAAPECGIAVPKNDAVALRDAIDSLAADPAESCRRGALGRAIAVTTYAHDRYLDSLARLYEQVLRRHERPTANSVTVSDARRSM